MDRWWLAYLDFEDIKNKCIPVEADSVSEAIEEAENVFKEKYPSMKNGGYLISVEKGVMTSNSVEPDYYNMTI